MRAILFLVGAVSLLSACQTGPETVESTRPTITLRYGSGTDLAQVEREADDYCARYNLNANLVDTGHQGSAPVALYECR